MFGGKRVDVGVGWRCDGRAGWANYSRVYQIHRETPGRSNEENVRKRWVDIYALIIAKITERSCGRSSACIQLGCCERSMYALVAPVSNACGRIYITLGGGSKKTRAIPPGHRSPSICSFDNLTKFFIQSTTNYVVTNDCQLNTRIYPASTCESATAGRLTFKAN